MARLVHGARGRFGVVEELDAPTEVVLAQGLDGIKERGGCSWNNPSVLGVTNWGFSEGAVWQPNSHLLNSDGTPRPALDWLTCFVAGGNDCSVPEYVPALPGLATSTALRSRPS